MGGSMASPCHKNGKLPWLPGRSKRHWRSKNNVWLGWQVRWCTNSCFKGIPFNTHHPYAILLLFYHLIISVLVLLCVPNGLNVNQQEKNLKVTCVSHGKWHRYMSPSRTYFSYIVMRNTSNMISNPLF